MIGDPLKKVSPGDPLRIRAETFNTFIDAARDYKARMRGVGRNVLHDTTNPGVVLVKNTFTETIQRFEAIGLGTSVVLPSQNLVEFKNKVAFESRNPSASYVGKFAVTTEPIPPGAIGRAIASGVTPVRIKVSDESHTHAEIDTEGEREYLLSSFGGSAVILWIDEEDPGDPEAPRWAIVRISNSSTVELLARIVETHPTLTLDDGSTARPIAVHRQMSGDYFDKIDVEIVKITSCGTYASTDTIVQADTNLLNGVHWTGRLVWVRLVGECYEIVSPGVYLWSTAVTQEAIPANFAGDVELFEDGPIVAARSTTSIADATACMVLFDDEQQEFVIFAQSCPPAPPEDYT